MNLIFKPFSKGNNLCVCVCVCVCFIVVPISNIIFIETRLWGLINDSIKNVIFPVVGNLNVLY